MNAVTQETLRILCKALQVDALPAKQVARVEQWTELPGFTVDRFRKLALDVKQRGTTPNSVAYFEPLVAETFRPLERQPELCRQPRLLSANDWPTYYQYQVAHYGAPDAKTLTDLWFRWNTEREVVGLPIEEKWYEIKDPLSRLPGGTPASDPLDAAA